MEEDDFDIYGGLDEFAKPTAEVIELKEKLRNVSEQLSAAEKKHENLINLNNTLKYNISTILLTARREITRKDERIDSLVKEKDAIVFRRAGFKLIPENISLSKTKYYHQTTQTSDNENMSAKYIQTDKQNVEISIQKQHKCVQTDSSVTVHSESSQTETSNKPIQTIRYVARNGTLIKMDHVLIQEFIDKRHQSAQTEKIAESIGATEGTSNSKSTDDDSDVIESLLALSRGRPKTDQPQTLINDDDFEKLLLDRQTILNELSKAESNRLPKKTIKKKSMRAIKLDAIKSSRSKKNLDIYEISSIRRKDKSKPIRQYGSGRDKQNTKQLHVLIKDVNLPYCNDTDKESDIGMELDNKNEQTPEIDTDAKPILKKAEIMKHSRKQTFTDIKTNCDLEHIPTEPRENKSKSKISRKRQLDSLFDDSIEETVERKKRLRPQKPIVTEPGEQNSKPILDLSPSDKSDDQNVPVCSTSKLKLKSPVILPLASLPNTDDQIESIPNNVEVIRLPPSEGSSTPALPPNNTQNEAKLTCSSPEPQAPLPFELIALKSSNIEDGPEKIPILNEIVCSQGGGQEDNQNGTLNSSVEIKMSTTSYKIETYGDETTVYIRRNKKKKKKSA